MATLNRKCTIKCKRWLGHTNLAGGKKPNMSSTPYPWPSPWFLWALDEPPLSLRNPWLSQPLVGDELPHLKRGIHYYISHIMLSSPGASSSYKEKSIKGKRHMNKGGNIKAAVTHVPQFAPSCTHIPRCGLPSLELPLYHNMWSRWFLQSPLRSIIISVATYHLRDVP